MISRGSTVHQTSHHLLCDALSEMLRAAVRAGPGAADGISSVSCRAVAALYLLLRSHPVDQQGRCRSCRRPGAVLGRRWRRCQLHAGADYWLHQPDQTLLLRQLTRELAPRPALPPAANHSPGTPTPTPPPVANAPTDPAPSVTAQGTTPESGDRWTWQREAGR